MNGVLPPFWEGDPEREGDRPPNGVPKKVSVFGSRIGGG